MGNGVIELGVGSLSFLAIALSSACSPQFSEAPREGHLCSVTGTPQLHSASRGQILQGPATFSVPPHLVPSLLSSPC